jgi:hypothetical protein
MKSKTLFVISFLLYFLPACIKNRENEPPKYIVSDELKGWGGFKYGTYWIYKNDSLNIEDSLTIYLYGTFDEAVRDSDWTQCYSENISSTTISTAKLTDFSFILHGKEKTIQINEFNENNEFRHKIKFSITFFSNQYINFERYDSIDIYNRKFINVIYQKSIISNYDEHDNTTEQNTADFWLAKNIGVIKKIIRNKYGTQEWYLKRFNIVQ